MTEQLSVLNNQKEVPKSREALQEKYDKEPKRKEQDLTSEHAKLPIPTGWIFPDSCTDTFVTVPTYTDISPYCQHPQKLGLIQHHHVSF